MDIVEFRNLLAEQGRQHWRDMPWRTDTQAYYVLVSEMMLQQTQVARVIPKFKQFVAVFADIQSLAAAELSDVLAQWQGLGYNRRAKYLHDAARMIMSEFDGQFPRQTIQLVRLPGVGNNTAGAIAVYSFNQPSLFVETNVRTVYLHHFFADQSGISDVAIREKLALTLDYDNPRQFYQALMDYGSWLKANGVNNLQQSRHYKKQSPLAGSLRQMRGEIVRRLTSHTVNWREDIEHDERFEQALDGLIQDGLIETANGDFRLTRSR
jgi:A/G-specific adenine glycosylase